MYFLFEKSIAIPTFVSITENNPGIMCLEPLRLRNLPRGTLLSAEGSKALSKRCLME